MDAQEGIADYLESVGVGAVWGLGNVIRNLESEMGCLHMLGERDRRRQEERKNRRNPPLFPPNSKLGLHLCLKIKALVLLV